MLIRCHEQSFVCSIHRHGCPVFKKQKHHGSMDFHDQAWNGISPGTCQNIRDRQTRVKKYGSINPSKNKTFWSSSLSLFLTFFCFWTLQASPKPELILLAHDLPRVSCFLETYLEALKHLQKYAPQAQTPSFSLSFSRSKTISTGHRPSGRSAQHPTRNGLKTSKSIALLERLAVSQPSSLAPGHWIRGLCEEWEFDE